MEVITNLQTLIAGATRLLKRKKYRPDTLVNYLMTWRRLAAYMAAQNLIHFNKDVADAFNLAWYHGRPYEALKKHETRHVHQVTVLWYYQTHRSLPPNIQKKADFAFEGKLGALFESYLTFKEDCCAPPTLRLYRYRLFPLYWDLLRDKTQVADIDGSYLIRFLSRLDLTQKLKEKKRVIEQTALFLRFLCSKNMLSNNNALYWASILKPRLVRQPKLPSIYSKEEVERLINAIDRSNAMGKRDFAIVLLGARYGLRGSDIMGLRHLNLDWANNRIVIIQQKTQKTVTLPLSEEVGNAIIDYLKFGRPQVNEPYIFLQARPPFGKMITIHKIITKYMQKAEIVYDERKHGPHALRHSLACNLLGLNEPMPVISQILGHSTTESTLPYLRVDFAQLKQCALEVPCVPSSFYTNVYEQAI